MRQISKGRKGTADRVGMITDLLLALVALAIVLSPVFIDAWMNHEPRSPKASQHRHWNAHFTS